MDFYVVPWSNQPRKKGPGVKKPNIFIIYRNKLLLQENVRPHKMPMQEFNRIASEKWRDLPDDKKEELRREYEISRDKPTSSDAIEEDMSEDSQIEEGCLTYCNFCSSISENPEICNICFVRQQYYCYDFLDHYYSRDNYYYFCNDCKHSNESPGICNVCTEYFYAYQMQTCSGEGSELNQQKDMEYNEWTEYIKYE